MYNRILKKSSIILSACLAILLQTAMLHTAAHAEDVSDWLKRADEYRLSTDSVRVELRVELYKSDILDRSRRYNVYIKPGRLSLVVFKSPGELGQKVLMRDEQFHMFMPKTRRAIRITPMQKLLGEASTGDIANMTWHEDYSARLLSDSETINGQACVLLELQSQRKGNTYERIELYLHKQTYAPVYARLYLTSGKLAKEASYTMGSLNGNTMVTGMTLIDRIKAERRTEVIYTDIHPVNIPDKYFNPQFLLRNQVD
jgi:hypothetical protein